MDEYIDKVALLKAFDDKLNDNPFTDVPDLIAIARDLPTANVAPVVRGKWIYSEDDYESHISCSECGYDAGYENFCPNCGAYNGGTDNGK